MLASQLQSEQFKSYPPQARTLAIRQLPLLRQLPTVFVAALLREVIGYDWRFPAEREQLDRQFRYLDSLQPQALQALFAGFAQIDLGPKLEDLKWVKEPEVFSERLTAFLWSTHQMDAFRVAATDYAAKLSQAVPNEPPRMSRLGIAVIGRGTAKSDSPLFRKLRPHGVLFTQVKPEDGLHILTAAVAARAAAHSTPYRHWYIDGGDTTLADARVSTISYAALQPVRAALLHRMREFIQSGGAGPEPLEVAMAALTPKQLGMTGAGADPVLDRFQVDLLTQGAGTQIFSTTFVQWAARETLRRAQPDTLLARYAPRQRQRPMNELLQGKSSGIELDPPGSLVDADMGSYYMWLDQQRLPHAKSSSFLVWFEGHREALGIGPSLPGGTKSDRPATLDQLLQWIA